MTTAWDYIKVVLGTNPTTILWLQKKDTIARKLTDPNRLGVLLPSELCLLPDESTRAIELVRESNYP